MSVATRLSEAGHYASQQIKQISAQLDQEWKSFAAALDERSTILAMSAVFHQKSEKVNHTLQSARQSGYDTESFMLIFCKSGFLVYGGCW